MASCVSHQQAVLLTYDQQVVWVPTVVVMLPALLVMTTAGITSSAAPPLFRVNRGNWQLARCREVADEPANRRGLELDGVQVETSLRVERHDSRVVEGDVDHVGPVWAQQPE